MAFIQGEKAFSGTPVRSLDAELQSWLDDRAVPDIITIVVEHAGGRAR